MAAIGRLVIADSANRTVRMITVDNIVMMQCRQQRADQQQTDDEE